MHDQLVAAGYDSTDKDYADLYWVSARTKGVNIGFKFFDSKGGKIYSAIAVEADSGVFLAFATGEDFEKVNTEIEVEALTKYIKFNYPG